MRRFDWSSLRASRAALLGRVVFGIAWATLWPGNVWAQTAEERMALRGEIDAQRAANQSTYTASRTACYQVFAVNDCLITAKKKHDTVQSELRRQEVILNDGERKRKSAAQWKKLDDKLRGGAEQAAIDQRAQRVEDAAQRQRNSAEKQDKAREKVAPTPRDTSAKLPRAAPTPVSPKQVPSHPVSPADQALAAQAYATKQAEALKHQNEVDEKRRTRAKPLSAPLPVTGAASTPLAAQLRASPAVSATTEGITAPNSTPISTSGQPPATAQK
jgi:colicin import membrane protein